MKFILLLLLIIVYVLFLKQTCACTENMEDLSALSVIPPVISTNNSRININELPECKMDMKIKFGSNQNSLINNGKQLVQNMTNPEDQSAVIGNKKHVLKQVSWTKSNLNWHDEEIPLEIRLTNTNIDDNTVTHIVFPVKLIDQNKLTEGFMDIKSINVDGIVSKISTFLSDPKTKDAMDDLGKKLNIPTINQELIDKIIPKNIQELIRKDISNLNIKSLVTKLTSTFPSLKDIPNINSEEVISKINNIKSELSGINLDKLDVKQILATNNVDLKSLDKKLNDINFNQIAQNFKNEQFSLYDINSFLNLNSILKDASVVPAYKCCGSTIGKVVNVDLCQTATKVVDQEKFFFTQGNDGSLVLITKPQPYDKTVGQSILNNLPDSSPLVVG